MAGTYFSRQVELAVQGLYILQCLASHQLLVQPDFVVCSRPWQEVLADIYRKLIHLSMKLGLRWNGRAEYVSTYWL